MSFALVTSVHENGETGIGPHALCFPFSITKPYAMLLISRATSATAANIRHTKRCALHYIEFDSGPYRRSGIMRGRSRSDRERTDRSSHLHATPAETGGRLEELVTFCDAGVNELCFRLHDEPHEAIRLIGERVIPRVA